MSSLEVTVTVVDRVDVIVGQVVSGGAYGGRVEVVLYVG
jgi:hypothetical protein